MINLIERAKLLSQFIHHGQKRYNGEDHFNHCERVANNFEDEEMKCIAYLHDSIENSACPHIIQHVIDEYFGTRILECVMILTHRKEFITYNQYLLNIYHTYPKLMEIKWADMIDNTNKEIPKRQKEKYRDGCYLLHSHGIEVPQLLRNRLGI